MFYIKNGEFRESKQYLQTSGGQIVFNASPEQWEAEGWIEYEKYLAQNSENSNGEEENPKTLQEIKEGVLRENENFFKDIILKVNFKGTLLWIDSNERLKFKFLLEDLAQEGRTNVTWKEQNFTLEEAQTALRKLNLYEYDCKAVYETHRASIEGLETEEELEYYDYTNGYPEPLILG